MPSVTPLPKLSGSIFVTVDDADRLRRFHQQIDLLRSFGWVINDAKPSVSDACDMQVIELARFKQQTPDIPTIILCKTAHDAAIEPDGFAMLSALGGGIIERDLAASVDTDQRVDKVLVGLNWTMIYAGDYCGIARSPDRGTQGARTIRPEAGFKGQRLRDLAEMLCSTDALSRSLGLAAINAFWNRVRKSPKKSGFSHFTPPGDGLVIIGGFRGVKKRLPNAEIIEREPKPGDVPVDQAERTIKNAGNLAITAQTLMNGSLEPLLRASHNVPFRMLIGPSAPLCPVLLDYGLDNVSGNVVLNRAACEQFILETGTMIMRDDLIQSDSICK